MIQTQPAEVSDFTGGIIDDFQNAPPNFAESMDNLNILTNRSLLQRPGSVIDDLDDEQIPAGVQRIGTLINYDNNEELLVQSAKRLYFRDPSSYSTLLGPTSNDPFSLGDTDSIVSHSQWNGHLLITNDDWAVPQKIFKDSGGTLNCVTAGLPALASDPTVTAGAAGANNYVYAFVYSYEHTVGSETFLDVSAVTLVELTNADAPDSNTVNITAIPVLANGGTGNYDTTNIKVFIYRTQAGGTSLYKIGEVTNGTTIFNDSAADTTIVNNELIYTEGGVLDNDAPPLCKFVHIVNGIAYYAHLNESGEILKGDILQSVQNDIDSVPAANRDTVDDEITGLSSVNETPIVLCDKKIFRIEGQFDELGRGFMRHIRIHDHAGCISNQSIVQAEQGLFWAGNEGFWFSDGYRCMKISDHLNDRYRQLLANMEATSSKKRIVGTYDEENRKIMWTVQDNSSSLDNDTIFTLDLRQGISDRMPFRTWSGTGDAFRPTSLVFYNRDLYRADTRGYVFKHNDEYTTDPKVDTTAAASTWSRNTIIYRYKSISSNFGTDYVRKWATRIVATMKNRSNISVQINAINDDGKFIRQLAEIRYRNNFVWGDPEFVWGNSDFVWNAEGLIQEWRRFPARGLRFSFLQIEITNAFTNIVNSDTIGQATTDFAAKTVTLDSAADADWPEDSVDYEIAFESDGYVKGYLVTARTDDTITVADPDGTLPVGSRKWVMRGYRKNEVMQLLSYTVHFALLSKTHTNLAAQNTGANA